MAKVTHKDLPTYTAEFTHDEACTLVAILNRVSGSPSHSRRGIAANILDAFESFGIMDEGNDVDVELNEIQFTTKD